ncbi:MAG: preprotein translocase subunit YajC [Holosporaceae bacterium]|jgi:preprotein translocase subunit YajC|nr:preprotein translocase subunit YajC [Holosporaceae bacterium]
MPAQVATTPTATHAQQPSFLGSLTPIVLMILVFYFLIMRPQQKREAKRRDLVNSVKKGDKILTTSGIIGTVHKIISEKEVSLEVAENVNVRILKNSITEVLEKKSELGNTEQETPNSESMVDRKTTTKKSIPNKK